MMALTNEFAETFMPHMLKHECAPISIGFLNAVTAAKRHRCHLNQVFNKLWMCTKGTEKKCPDVKLCSGILLYVTSPSWQKLTNRSAILDVVSLVQNHTLKLGLEPAATNTHQVL